ncbi:MAG: hypothetical protein HRU23_08740 [Gammaproteobacteria bacterium]|nr:hypothetical protein [Gammaproteobacteria bacterium]
MKHVIALAVIIFIIFKVLSPNAQERYDVGFSDGHAVGYNAQCNIRATTVAIDLNNEDYFKGYNNGKQHGIKACIDESNE